MPLYFSNWVSFASSFFDGFTHPHTLTQTICFNHFLCYLTQLERLEIGFLSPIPSRELERQLLHTPITTHITLSNLRWFDFRGISAYLESLLPQTITPRLGDLRVRFFNQFLFYHQAAAVRVYPPIENASANYYLEVTCEHLDWQVSSVAQIFNVLRALFSDVIDLTLGYKKHSLSSEWHNQADGTLKALARTFGII